MFCNQCGARIADGSVFCNLCGTRQGVVVPAATPPVNPLPTAPGDSRSGSVGGLCP